MARWLAILGAASGGLAVICGAFAAHALRERVEAGELTARHFEVFQTGATYQMYHALALLAAAWLLSVGGGRWAGAAGVLFLAGTVVFSGSLYLLTLTGASGWGAVTPIGGVAFILGWACLAIAAALNLRS